MFVGATITNAKQCLLGKEPVWLRERPAIFESSSEPRIEILNCHQSLISGEFKNNRY